MRLENFAPGGSNLKSVDALWNYTMVLYGHWVSSLAGIQI